MKKILVLGAGRSATTLIRYLDAHAAAEGWRITVADADARLLEEKLTGLRYTSGEVFQVAAAQLRRQLVESHDFVISLLPWTLHMLVARECLRAGRHLITASYVTPEMRTLSAKAHKKGLFFMGELGLDPGLDHMSALQLLSRIRAEGGVVQSFHSYAGGLISEECDTNPWHYKFTWNPRNVVLAGQGIAQYREESKVRYSAWPEIFSRATPIAIGEDDRFEVYPNRDSLKYVQLYGLQGIPSILRGTVRWRGFSRAWYALARLGLTEAQSPLELPDAGTWAALMDSLLPGSPAEPAALRCARFLGEDADGEVMRQLTWLGLFEALPLGLAGRTAADYLQELLEDKWRLAPEDRDLVVMEHRVRYLRDGGRAGGEWRSTLVHKGKNALETAMADLVGLPLAVTTRLFLRGALPGPTLPVPFEPAIYQPVMAALEEVGVHFRETHLHEVREGQPR